MGHTILLKPDSTHPILRPTVYLPWLIDWALILLVQRHVTIRTILFMGFIERCQDIYSTTWTSPGTLSRFYKVKVALSSRESVS